jgi:zinc D-Ala-D-Ala carboxypeptidase
MNDLTDKDFERWPNFTRAELACKGDGECRMDPEFMDHLQALRIEYGAPMAISSGYRSPDYNAGVSDTGTDGVHTTGRAVDVLVRGADAVRLLQLAMRHGFTGFGISQKGNSRFLHLDMGNPAKYPRPALWSY